MLSFVKTVGLSLLLSRVAAQGGLPADIVGFEPLTDVRDQALIDLDQKSINELLDAGDFTNALALYTDGSHSKSVSTLTVTDGLPVAIAQGANLTGVNEAGDSVRLFAQGSNYTAGATELKVQYKDEGCFVGANTEPETEGCLAPSGNLTLDDGTSFAYSHDPATSSNVYSIFLFTQGTEYVFDDSGDNYTVDFQKFVNYYGSPTYADDIFQAAIAGKSTSFSTGNDIDASKFTKIGQSEIAKKASAYMAVWMYVIRELEHAIYLCETGDCAEESCLGKAAVHEVDEAVAFYAGSLAPSGVLTYNLAAKRALEFGTLNDGAAEVNIDLLEAFNSAKSTVVAADCAGLRTATTKIVQLMTIPLVQGALKYTASGTSAPEDELAERAIFAATVLPFVNACNPDDAETIYTNTMAGATTIDLAAVKTAFANTYECMGITADQIGTYSATNSTGNNTTGGGGGNSTDTSAATGAAHSGWALGAISLFLGMLL